MLSDKLGDKGRMHTGCINRVSYMMADKRNGTLESWQEIDPHFVTFINALAPWWASFENRSEMARLSLQSKHCGGILRLLLYLPDEKTSKDCFDELINLASMSDQYIWLSRRVIKTISLPWVRENLWASVEKVLLRNPEDYGCYRWLAELCDELDSDALAKLVSMARQSKDIDILEVADDYTKA